MGLIVASAASSLISQSYVVCVFVAITANR